MVFLQLIKPGPPIKQTFPAFFRWFLLAVVMAKRSTVLNLHILTARGMSHIFYSNCPTSKQEKNYCALVRSPKSKFTNQKKSRLQYFRVKKSGQKPHFIGTLRTFALTVSANPYNACKFTSRVMHRVRAH